jgi:hypothetical protein
VGQLVLAAVQTGCLNGLQLSLKAKELRRCSVRGSGRLSERLAFTNCLYQDSQDVSTLKREVRSAVSQEFTFIDVAGNRAQYTVSEKDHHNDFRWSTDHGDHGVAASFAEAQYQARTVLNASMSANRPFRRVS